LFLQSFVVFSKGFLSIAGVAVSMFVELRISLTFVLLA
jgi:hypothetical protein